MKGSVQEQGGASVHLEDLVWDSGEELRQLRRGGSEQPREGRCSSQHELANQRVNTGELGQASFFLKNNTPTPPTQHSVDWLEVDCCNYVN